MIFDITYNPIYIALPSAKLFGTGNYGELLGKNGADRKISCLPSESMDDFSDMIDVLRGYRKMDLGIKPSNWLPLSPAVVVVRTRQNSGSDPSVPSTISTLCPTNTGR